MKHRLYSKRVAAERLKRQDLAECRRQLREAWLRAFEALARFAQRTGCTTE